MLANVLSYYRGTSYFFSGNANDPFRQQKGVGELCKCIIFHSKFVQVQKVRLKCKLNYPSQFLHMFAGPYLGFFVCGGKLGFREISDQYSYKKQPSKIRHYVRKKTFSFPGGGNCPLRPPAMYGPGLSIVFK